MSSTCTASASAWACCPAREPSTTSPESGTYTLTAGNGDASGSFSGVIQSTSGVVALTKTGGGTLILAGTDNYTGGTTVGGGTLQVGYATALGSTSGAATISTGVLDLHGFNVGVGRCPAREPSTTSPDPDTYTLTAGNGDANGSFSGVIQNTIATIALTKTGGGTLTLGGSNTYTGGTTLSAGQLNLNNASALGTGASTISGGTIGNTSGGTIGLSTNNAQNWNGDFTFAGANDLDLGAGAVTMSSSRTVTVASNTLTVGGGISDNSSGFSLTKTGDGTLTLGGSNTYTGGTTLSAGRLNLNNASALGSGVLTISGGTIGNTSGGTVALSTNNVQNWNGDFTFAGPNDLDLGAGAVTMSSSRTVTVASNTLIVEGGISDSGSGFSLTKTGAGTLVLAGSNTYTGGTTVSEGTLDFAGPDATPTEGIVTVNPGGYVVLGALLRASLPTIETERDRRDRDRGGNQRDQRDRCDDFDGQ